MNRRLKEALKRGVPMPVLVRGLAAYSRFRSRRARAAFDAAGVEPAWLGRDDLARLQDEYPLPQLAYYYDEQSVDQRGRTRAADLARLAARVEGRGERFLDLGSWDGMVCDYLRAMGKTAVGVDNRLEGFAPETVARGTMLAGMDAGRLAFADDSFDFIFSYNSLEHFPDPEQVLREALRVLRPGGQIYLNFGPLWYSARGAHQYQTISVPYCECLFPVPLIETFAAEEGIELVDFAHMNRWPLSRYRALWRSCAPRLQPVFIYEIQNADYVELIERYPTCFRSKTAHFDDLIVSNIEALFVKR